MRLAAVAVTVGVLVGACSGALDLDVRVDHPDGLAVTTTTVTVYESPTLTCIDVAFSRIGSDELSAVEIAQQSVMRNGDTVGALTGISRTDHKVIVARGYDADGVWIAAGCAEQDLVEESTTIRISTMVTVTPALVVDDMSDQLIAVIATTDAQGHAVADRRVAWTAYGPAGSQPMPGANVETTSDGVWQPTKASCTKATGAASVHPPPPDVIGGYTVQLAAEWGTTLPPRFSRLLGSFARKMLTPPSGSSKFCAIRRANAVQRLVCLEGAFAYDYEVVVTNGMPDLVSRGMTSSGVEPLNVVSVPNGNDLDVYVVSSKGELTPVFGAATPDNSDPPCGDGSCVVEDVLAVPSCGAQPGKLLMKLDRGGPGQVKQLPARGGASLTFPTDVLAGVLVKLDNAGCVSRVDLAGAAPVLRQVVTYHVGSNVLTEFVVTKTVAAYACTAASCQTNEGLLPGAGVGFRTDSESRMVAPSVDATGVVLSELVMAPHPDLGRDVFIERRRIPSASIPDHIVVGTFDADGERDLFWSQGTRRGTSFEVAYARMVGDLPLAALSGSQPVQVSALLTGDLTGDGFDDVIGVGGIENTFSGVVVIPAGARAAAISVPADPTCP